MSFTHPPPEPIIPASRPSRKKQRFPTPYIRVQQKIVISNIRYDGPYKSSGVDIDIPTLIPNLKNINVQKIRRLLARIIIETPIYSPQFIFEQMQLNQLQVPKSRQQFYQIRFGFILDAIRYLEHCIQTNSTQPVQKISKKYAKPLMGYFFKCRQQLHPFHLQIVIDLIKIRYDIQEAQIPLDNLINFHQFLLQMAIERRINWNEKRQRKKQLGQVSKVKDVVNKGSKKYVSKINTINHIWTEEHTEYLKAAFQERTTPKNIEIMFKYRFPQHNDLWNSEALLLQWYKICRTALRALYFRISRDIDVQYMEMPPKDNNFEIYLTRKAINRDIQLNMVSIMDEGPSSGFVQETIYMINQSWKQYEQKMNGKEEEEKQQFIDPRQEQQ